MELIEVEAFVAIAQSGNFTRAAAALGISQPAISRRIELLENELGLPLFERVHSGARLTSAGTAFLPYAQQTLAAVRDGASAVAALQSGQQGVVSLALVGTLASTGLTQRLRRFREQWPHVRIALRTARSAEVSALVQQGEATLGLRYFEDPSPAIASLQAETELLVVVCAAHAEETILHARTAEQLRGVPWVGFPATGGSSGEPFTMLLQRTLISAGLEGAEFIAIDSLTAQKRLIEAGFGVGLLPVSSIDEEVRIGTLQVLPIESLQSSVPVMAIHRRNGYLDPAARRLLDALTGA